jgi:hypothetical protein
MLSIIILSCCFFIHSVRTRSNIELNISLEFGENNTMILFYNLTSNYSYFITFRSFGNKQLKFGLFSPIKKFEEHSMNIFYRYNTSEFVYLFIICFHFILQLNDLNIQCQDLRLFESNINKDFLPSYNPLFVPMMYALSVLMLLPVIVQHHRHKKAQSFRRRKELRRLSVSIAQDQENPKRNFARKILSQIIENGNINYDKTPMDIELVSAPSTKTILDDLDDHTNVAFTLDNLQPLIHRYDDNDIEINAHDCIAHLLDSTPWTTSYRDQPLTTSLSRYSVVPDSARAIKEQYVPTIISLHDDEDDRKPILKTKNYSTENYSRTNRTFIESDV